MRLMGHGHNIAGLWNYYSYEVNTGQGGPEEKDLWSQLEPWGQRHLQRDICPTLRGK